MRKLIFFISSALLLGLVFACQNKSTETPGEVVVESLSFNKNEGKDCDKPDSLRYNCASINLSWPNVTQGSNALKKSVANWATAYLASILAPGPDGKPAASAPVEDKAVEFIKAQKDFAKDAPKSPMAYFTAESTDQVLLNDGKYLTLQIEGYTYMGGAHGSPTAAVATFDVLIGKQLTWSDLVTDQKALQAVAEQAFRTERADVFQPGDGAESFVFDDIFQFALPQNYGLVENGIFCYYLAYEVGPYAMGSTQFVIPFAELGEISKIKAPAGSEGAVSDIYTEDGDNVVIPTFEIEVSNSPKADQTLGKQKETILVAAFFSGEPSNDKDRDEEGQLFISKKEIELSGNNRIARFEGLKFPKKLYNKLADKDINLLINVYSGRKASQDNLLDCGIMEAKVSKLVNKRFTLGCKLIAETTANPAATSTTPIACYALPDPGEAPTPKLALLISCTEDGQIEWAGQPMKDFDELMANLRTLLTDRLKQGAKELPDIETEGCMMGASGEIRTLYEELKAELLKTK
jgi:hypothetical protein